MRAKRTLTWIVALTLGAGVFVAACGGDDGSDGEASTITEEQWIAQANEICRKGDEEMERAAQKAFAAAQKGGEPDARAEQRFLERVVAPSLADQVAQIAALPRPEGDEEEIEAIVAAAGDGVEKVNADPGALEQEPDPFKEATRLIATYGVTDCG